MEYFSIIVFGWPSAILGWILLASGMVLRKAKVTAIGAAVATGFCAYVSMNPPPIRWFGLVAFAGNWVSVVAIRRRSPGWAAASMLPFIVLIMLAAYAVFAQ